MNEEINVTVKGLTPFKKFCMTIGELPSSYVETLTYYEMLTWFTKYLTDTVIPTINNNAEAVEEVQNIVMEFQDYINNYFDNLDVQEEINNKLDEMTQDGTLTSLIGQYIDPIVTEQNAQINQMRSLITEVKNNNPIPVNSTAEMDDVSKIYVLLTDGYWYYYNTTSDEWTQGGLFQSSVYDDIITATNIPINIIGFIKASDGLLNMSGGYLSSDYVEVNSRNYITGYLCQRTNVVALVAFYDSDKNFLGAYWGEDPALTGFINVEQSIPSNCKYIRVSTKAETGYNAYVRLNVLDYINDIESDIEQSTPITIGNTGYLRPNGTVSSTNGFKYSDYIDVQFGETVKAKLKQVSGNIGLVCFYDENKQFINSYTGDGTEETKFVDIELQIPLNAKYIRISSKADVVGYYGELVSNVKNWLTTINGLISETNDSYYVDQSATSSGNVYSSLIDCLKHIMAQNYTYPVNVYIKGGTYDILEELGGTEFLESITSGDTAYTIDQPWLYNVNLIGCGNVVLEYKPTSEVASQYPLAEGLVAPLNIRGNVNIENITIECQYCRYAIHDETSGESKFFNTYHNYKNVNCKMITKSEASTGGHTIGLGFDNGQSYMFENCKLSNTNSATTTNAPLFIHNRESVGGNFTMNNCIFESVGNYGLILSNVLEQAKTTVNISNSNLNKQIFIRSENNADIPNCYALFINNSNEITITLQNHITSNPYIPVIKNTIS